jgi:hypothetical protein
LRDPALLAPVHAAWACSARDRGRPSIAIDVFVRLMVVKQRTGWASESVKAWLFATNWTDGRLPTRLWV